MKNEKEKGSKKKKKVQRLKKFKMKVNETVITIRRDRIEERRRTQKWSGGHMLAPDTEVQERVILKSVRNV